MALADSNSSRVTQIVDRITKRLVFTNHNIIKKKLTEIFMDQKERLSSFPRKLAPYNRLGDKLICLYDFYTAHRRIPTNKLIFNDVLYKIKTTDEIVSPLRVFVTDKEFVKLFVKAVLGDQHTIPTLTVLHSMDEVRNYPFPSECCIKPTHASGHVILRKNGEEIDFKKIERWFNLNFYRVSREANYKALQQR